MADDKASDKKKTKVKRPSALKRDIQAEKNRLANRAFRARVLTAVRALEEALEKKAAPETMKENLKSIYSLMDKGVKKGVYKPNTAARTKSRLTARFS